MDSIYWTEAKVGDYVETFPPLLYPHRMSYPKWRGCITKIQTDAQWGSPDIIAAVNKNGDELIFTWDHPWRVNEGPCYAILHFSRKRENLLG